MIVLKMKYYLFIALLLLLSCSQKEQESPTKVISVDLSIVGDEGLFDEFNYIPLETSDDCLLSPHINRIVKSKEAYVIHSIVNNCIISFTEDGQFLKRMTIGNGPNDLLYPVDMTYDATTDHIWVLDSYRFIKEFTIDGIRKETKQVEDAYVRIGKLNEHILLYDANFGRRNDYYFAFLSGDSIQKFVNKKPDFIEIAYLPNSTFNIINDTTVYFYHQFEDILYSWTANSHTVTPKYFFDFNGEISIASVDFGKTLKIREEYQKMYDDKKYIFGVKNLYISEQMMLFTVETDELYFCLYDMQAGKMKISKQLIDGLPNPRNIIGFDNGSILYTINPNEILDYKEEFTVSDKIATHLNIMQEDDNPIIIVCKINS